MRHVYAAFSNALPNFFLFHIKNFHLIPINHLDTRKILHFAQSVFGGVTEVVTAAVTLVALAGVDLYRCIKVGG